MTEQEARNRIVNVAAGLVGKAEADQSYMPILDAYNAIRPLPRGYRMKPEDPWCAAFVSAVGAMCGMSGAVLPECSCDAMIALYRARGAYHGRGYAAKPGDLIFYNWDGDSSADHVGIVEAVIPGGYRIIEGNKSDEVGRRSVPADWQLIQGFASPDYGDAEEPDESEAPSEEAPGTPGETVTPPTLRYGDKSESVVAMQGILIARGFSCGSCGADGDFGPYTRIGLRRFKKSAGLADDDTCDAATWRALLGVTV